MFQLDEFEWLGLIDYTEGLNRQQTVGLRAKTKGGGCILGLEHEFVVTHGARTHLKAQSSVASRGGLTTLHSPGQLVIYPVIQITGRWRVRQWVDHLLEVTRLALLKVGISTAQGSHPGLWTEDGKIAFIGVRISAGVNYHGLAINVRNDLSLFSGIEACGVKGASMDSAERRGVTLQPRDLFRLWMEVWHDKQRNSSLSPSEDSI